MLQNIFNYPVTSTLAANNDLNVGVGIPGSSGPYTYNTYVRAIYNFSLELGFSLAVLMIIYAGYKYLTSAGNQQAVNDAKEILLGALLGFALLFLVRFILSWLGLPNQGITGPGPTKT